MRKSKQKLLSYSGDRIRVMGQTTLLFELQGKMYPIKFHIIEVDSQPLLGVDKCEKEFKIIKRVYSVVQGQTKVEESNSKEKGSVQVITV